VKGKKILRSVVYFGMRIHTINYVPHGAVSKIVCLKLLVIARLLNMVPCVLGRNRDFGWRIDQDSGTSCVIEGLLESYPQHTFQLRIGAIGAPDTVPKATIHTETDTGDFASFLQIQVDDEFSLADGKPTCQAYMLAFEGSVKNSQISEILTGSRTEMLVQFTTSPGIDARHMDECPQYKFELPYGRVITQDPVSIRVRCGIWGTFMVASPVKLCISSVEEEPVEAMCNAIADFVDEVGILIP
jgi:hypothetical protein